MFWRILFALGGITFVVTGVSVLTDETCRAVTWSTAGAGARRGFTATCWPIPPDDLLIAGMSPWEPSAAGLLSVAAGLGVLLIAGWPVVRAWRATSQIPPLVAGLTAQTFHSGPETAPPAATHKASQASQSPEPEAADVVRVDGENVAVGPLRPETAERLRASQTLTVGTLADLFEDGVTRPAWDELDLAVQMAMDLRIWEISGVAGVSDQFRSEVGSYVIAGYLVGRHLVGSHNSRLKYSGPAEAALNATRLLARQGALDLVEVVETAGPGAVGFINAWPRVHGLMGEQGEDQQAIGQVAILNGIAFAVAEDECFVSGRS